MSATPVDISTDVAASRAEHRPRTVQVWDLPLRVFHWTLVLAILAAYLTAEFGGSSWAQWHGRIGALVLALLVFRLLWGLIGTEHARFSSFAPTPARVVAYLRGRWQGRGHSPLGALSVIALLVLVAAQVTTGLFSNDDIAFAGPLADLIGTDTSNALSGWHQKIFWVLAGFIGLHLAAIVFYVVVRRLNLVKPMITGKAIAASHERANVPQFPLWRFLAAVLVAVMVTCIVFSERPDTQQQSADVTAATARSDW